MPNPVVYKAYHLIHGSGRCAKTTKHNGKDRTLIDHRLEVQHAFVRQTQHQKQSDTACG